MGKFKLRPGWEADSAHFLTEMTFARVPYTGRACFHFEIGVVLCRVRINSCWFAS